MLAADWNGRNALRSHPLDDAATAVDDSGTPLPPDILVDCSIRFPESAGATLFLSSAVASPRGACVTFQATNRTLRPSLLGPPAADPAFQPIAVAAVAGRVTPGVAIPVIPAIPGVSGWVVFGPGAGSTNYSGKFSTLEQSAILPGRARSFTPPLVTSLGVGSTAFGEIVKLLGGNDATIAATTLVDADDNAVRAIAIGLVDDSSGETLKRYVGPCGGRLETETCDPPGIESVNEVPPDAAGDLRIRFIGVNAHPIVDNVGGYVLDVPTMLDEICPPPSRIAVDPNTGSPLDQRNPGNDRIDFRETGLDDVFVALGVFSADAAGAKSRDPVNVNLATATRDASPRWLRVAFAPPPFGGASGVAWGWDAATESFMSARVVVWPDGKTWLELSRQSPAGRIVVADKLAWSPPPASPRLNADAVELTVLLGEPDENNAIRVTVEAASNTFVDRLVGVVPATNHPVYGIVAVGDATTFQTLEVGDDVPD